ncbi:MAG: phosphoribosylanthranilate isomerase [Actinomycetota bacterium]|nr:phosphoribosylanthranilate isomerase [Actinomycetota bacterium]
MTRVKLCGITSFEDAQMCLEHRPWALGLIFVPHSPRKAKLSVATAIAAAVRRQTEVAGVFQNATLDHVTRTAEHVGLSILQLHGDEGPSYCVEAARRTGAKVMKAVRVRTREEVVSLRSFAVDFHMLDGAGGGQPFEWSLARERRSDVPLVVAGSLTPENVGAAIEATKPFAVDVARGIEARPGVKDPEKVAAFVRAAEGALV